MTLAAPGRARRWLLALPWLAMALQALAGAAPARAVDGWNATPLPVGVDAVTNAQSGFAVALDGDRAVVGARFDGPTGAGRVYVFFWSGTAWTQEAVLEGAVPGDQFGIAVALRADMLAVAAVGEEQDGQLPTGTVHVFVGTGMDGSRQWSERSTVVGDPGVRQVGRAVTLDAEWLAVAGAVEMPDGAHGIVRMYPLAPHQGIVPGSTGELLLRVDPQPRDRFGESLAMAAGILVVGAPAHAGGGGALPAAGTAYVYVPTAPPAASLLPVATLQAADAVADGNFGSAVAMSGRGNTLAVGAAGAPWPSAGIGRPGAVYVFTSSTGAWMQQARLAASPAAAGAGDHFGQAVGLDGDLLVVGAPQHARGDRVTATGAAFLFQLDPAPGTWADVPGAAATMTCPQTLYGFAVALSQGGFLVGAPLANGRAGAACAFLPIPEEGPFAARAAAAVRPMTAAPPAAVSSATTVRFPASAVPP